MAISFNETPNFRIPIVSAEFDSSRASQGPALLAYRVLMLGQKLSSGTGDANAFYPVTSPDRVATLAGRGSILHRMAIAWFASNTSTELVIGILEDHASGVQATGTITITGAATEDGVLHLYFGGVHVPVVVSNGDAVADVASAIAAAITANADLPVTARSTLGVVTYTFRNDGEVGNGYDVRDSYLTSQEVPAGISVAYSGTSGGSNNPLLTDIIAAMGDSWYQLIVHPYTDATSLTAIENELASRFGPTRMIDGVAFSVVAGCAESLRIVVHTQHFCRAQFQGGQRQNAGPAAVVNHPGAHKVQAVQFGQAQGCCGVGACAEREARVQQ